MKIISLPTRQPVNRIKLHLRIIILFLVIFLSSVNLKAQDFSIGGFIGGGYMSGESPDIGAFTTSIFVDQNPGFHPNFYLRFSFVFTGDFDKIFPGKRYDHFSYMKGITLKGIITQDLTGYFLEEGVGFIYLNDRTFSTINEWNYGIVFSITAGFDFTYLGKGFRVGAGPEYALAIGGTFPKYFSLHLLTRYTF